MIQIEGVWRRDVLQRITARGHALAGPPGGDPVCGGVSLLLRSAGRILQEADEVQVEVSAPRRGEMALRVVDYPEELEGWLQGVSALLLRGLMDVSQEFPDSLSIRFKNK